MGRGGSGGVGRGEVELQWAQSEHSLLHEKQEAGQKLQGGRQGPTLDVHICMTVWVLPMPHISETDAHGNSTAAAGCSGFTGAQTWKGDPMGGKLRAGQDREVVSGARVSE